MSEFIDTLRDPSNSSLVCKVLVLDAAAALEQMTAEVARLTMMLDEYVRLDNAGKIPLEPVGGKGI